MFRDVLPGIHADALDCLQANLAVFADAHHGAGTHLRLGARTGFEPVFGAGLPTVAATVDDRLAQARRWLGLSVTQRHDGVTAADVVSLLSDGEPRYLVADAFGMPWLPYHGHEHVEHSFLAVAAPGGVQVTDAYHNVTPRGTALPGVWLLTESEFVAALDVGENTVISLQPVALPEGHDETAPVDPAVVGRYVAAYRDHTDRRAAFTALTLETWLLARERRMRVALTGDPASASRLPGWQRLTEQVYVALRRVEAGRGAPSHVFEMLSDLLNAEGAPAAHDGPDAAGAERDTRVRATIVAVLARILGIGAEHVTADFRTMPGFDSFRLVDLIQQTESALDIEIPPDELVAANMADLDALTRLFARAVVRGGVHA
ncbi:acyl carrier protein [Amycolatopsis mediterranei]|uniref:acyl carrier protein n=1 Tax=Amycolatopsis mediterranei TaxID=33910 RepID=UPI003421FCE3